MPDPDLEVQEKVMVDLLTPVALEEAARKQVEELRLLVEDMSVLSSKNTFSQETMMLDLLTPEEMAEPVRKPIEDPDSQLNNTITVRW